MYTVEIKKKISHQILLQRHIINKTEKCRCNGQFARQIQNSKVKSGSDKWSKQSHNS